MNTSLISTCQQSSYRKMQRQSLNIFTIQRVSFAGRFNTLFARRLDFGSVNHASYPNISETDLSLIDLSFFAASSLLTDSSLIGSSSTGCQSTFSQNSQSSPESCPAFTY